MKMKTIYHTSKTGAIVEWDIWTEGADIVTEFGQRDGKKQLARKTATSKNVGRSNETTPEDQAILEMQSMHKKKLDGKYSTTLKGAKQEVFLPMLASSFDKRKDKVTYPVDVQPKLDGVRCLAFWNGDHVELMSRGGKKWECCGHIVDDLQYTLPKGMVLDGELYIHGKTFQEITKLVKKWRPESEDVIFHVYDVVKIKGEDAGEWKDRYCDMLDWATDQGIGKNSFATSVTIVTTYESLTEAGVYELQSQFLEDGYEGAIVREWDGRYELGHRSTKLLKVKNFCDGEYEIVRFTTGVGRFSGCIIWICVTEDGNEFKVVPQGTMEERKLMYDEAEDHIGELLKVKSFELTDDNIPRFPVGIGIRLVEDM